LIQQLIKLLSVKDKNNLLGMQRLVSVQYKVGDLWFKWIMGNP